MAVRRRLAVLATLAALTIGAACSGSTDDAVEPSASAAASSAGPTTAPSVTLPASTNAPVTTVGPTVATTATSIAPPTTTLVRALDEVVAPEASTVDGLLALDRPVILAHAGGDFDAPHSTMFAYTRAALAGVDALELDVTITSDGVLVVQHDATVDRTMDATGVVRELTFDELAALDNAYWYSGGVWVNQRLPDNAYLYRGVRTGERPPPEGYGPDDFSVPTFRQVADAFPDHVLDVEIKVFDGDLATATEAAQVLAAEIAELDRTDSVVVVSFDDEVLDAFRAAAPDVATSPATGALTAWFFGDPSGLAPQDVVFQAPPFFDGIEVLNADTVARAAAEGYPVWAYMNDTANQENADFYRLLVGRGVDGLIVSRPAEAVTAVR